MAKYVGALDQGTTSTRFMVFDHAGKVVAIDQKEHEQIFPKPGWVEHDPMEIWERTQEVIKGALEKADIDREGHRRGRHHQPARDGGRLGQEDRQAGLQRDRLAGHPHRHDRQRARQGRRPGSLPRQGRPAAGDLLLGPEGQVDPRQRRRRARGKAERGDLALRQHRHLVIWNLTGGTNGGVHVTDVTNASRTMLMDLETLDWDDEILERHGHPAVDAARDPASSARSTATAIGDLAGIPVAGVLGDQQAALFGQTCFSAGEAKNTYGTGCFMLLNTGTETVPVQERPADDARLQDRRRSRRSTPSKARSRSPARSSSGCATTSGMISSRRRGRGAGQDRRGQRRRLLRPGVLAACSRRTGSRDARGVDRRPDPLRQQGPHRPRRRSRRPPGRPARCSTR